MTSTVLGQLAASGECRRPFGGSWLPPLYGRDHSSRSWLPPGGTSEAVSRSGGSIVTDRAERSAVGSRHAWPQAKRRQRLAHVVDDGVDAFAARRAIAIATAAVRTN